MTPSKRFTFLASAAAIPLVAPAIAACGGSGAATAWPPLLATGTPTAGGGLTSSKLATVTRPGGSHQATYNGHPVYLYVGDSYGY